MKKIFKALAIAAASAAMCLGVAMSTGCTGGSGTYYGGYHYIGAHSATPYGMVVEVTVENNIITSVKDITNTDNENAKNIQTYKDVIDGKEAAEATHHNWTVVSTGWETYFNQLVNLPYAWILTYGYDLTKNGLVADGYDAATDANSLYYVELDADGNRTNKAIKWEKGVIPAPAATNIHSYGWTDKACSNWTGHESWLLQQYIGWSVADVLAIDVHTNYGYKLVTVDGKTTQALDTNSKGEPYGVDYNAGLSESELLISGATQGSGRLLLAIQNALGK